MMLKFAVFDLDGTLAEPNQPISPEVGRLLRDIETRGLRVAIASGKNYEFLLEKADSIKLENAVIIAENGCVVFSREAALRPLERFSAVASSDPHLYQLRESPAEITAVRRVIDDEYGESVWFQPNLVELTVFPRSKALIPEIASRIVGMVSDMLTVIAHDDAIDVIPSDFDKGRALRHIREVLQISPDETTAVGNARNDIPLFRESRLNYIVGDSIRFEGATNFATVEQVLSEIINRTGPRSTSE